MSNTNRMGKTITNFLNETAIADAEEQGVSTVVSKAWELKDLECLTAESVMDTPEFKEGMKGIVTHFIEVLKGYHDED